ncbi:MAG: cell division/cell wall cluster transcriptional repressor MraZ [Gammaproteobacteria bacterium]|nr:cell division/cell wall cluster transcriptional repressor MraZ [Gammaproteobacteria bacterium]
MYRGVNNINLDAKGRLAIPTRHREILHDHCNGHVVVTIDIKERSLLIYPLPYWQDVERSVQALPSLDPVSRELQRLLIGYATDIQMDGSGRVLLTAPLREYAHLDRKAVLLGEGNKLELWSEARWHAHRDSVLDRQSELQMSDALKNLTL